MCEACPELRDLLAALAECGRQLQSAGDDLSEIGGFVGVARSLQCAGEVLANAAASEA